jgi:hypothetical protein
MGSDTNVFNCALSPEIKHSRIICGSMQEPNPESVWMQKWHVHVENVQADHGDYTVGDPHVSE